MFYRLTSFLKSYLMPIVCVLLCVLVGFASYKAGHSKGVDDGYDNGYNAGYSKGYSDGYADRNKLTENSTVKTETKVIYEKIPYNGTDVQVKTEPPKVTLEVNGKKQEIKQKQETADLAVQTTVETKIKIPERRWSIGIGTDGKKPMFMLKAPVKDAVGLWVAGGSKKVMGGISISF